MRFGSPASLSLAALLAVAACGSKQSATAADGGDDASEGDASTAACTSIGGTCQPTVAPDCPLLQQNPTLCGDVLLVCCVSTGSDATIEEIDDGGATDASTIPTPDASDASDASTVVDAASTVDASHPVDAASGADATSSGDGAP
jgi:hypothetical protein